MHLDGLLTNEQREGIVKKLMALQRADGGWSLPSLGNYQRHNGQMNDAKEAPSDGYGTGFVLYVLRQAGVPAEHEQLRRGVQWLKANQRASGRWFTRSLSTDMHHFITHAGTAYAIMALAACGE
jgi:squalene-hopene/tetraprenyl-beta-curcumene cyclase